ncbi:MAG: hypothetical protein ACRYGK_13000, partial [Janthinobacterium lividum]
MRYVSGFDELTTRATSQNNKCKAFDRVWIDDDERLRQAFAFQLRLLDKDKAANPDLYLQHLTTLTNLITSQQAVRLANKAGAPAQDASAGLSAFIKHMVSEAAEQVAWCCRRWKVKLTCAMSTHCG